MRRFMKARDYPMTVRGFAPCYDRIFESRYTKTKITYRDGVPWEREISSHGGWYSQKQLLQPVSIEAMDAALDLLFLMLDDEPPEGALLH